MSSKRKRHLCIFFTMLLAPLWGIGGLQLLCSSTAALPELFNTVDPKQAFDGIMHLLVSLLSFFLGMYFLVDFIRQYFQDQMKVWSVNKEIEERLKLNSSVAYDEGDGPLSYARVWYMSFQSHLSSQSGFDTLQLKPLKRWPNLLKQHIPEDLLPVWLIPLLLMALLAVPMVALLVAAANALVSAFTGVSICELCLNVVVNCTNLLTDCIWSFPAAWALGIGACVVAATLRKSYFSRKQTG